MTAEQYYWYVKRPLLLRAKIAGFAKLQQADICEVTFEGTNCVCKIDGEERFHKIISIGSDVTVEVIPNEGYMFTSWSDGNTDNPRTWNNVQGDFVAKAAIYEDFGPLCFTLESGFDASITLKSRESGKENTPVNDICPDLNLQYSYDGTNWNVYDMTKTPSLNTISLMNGGNNKVYFKAITTNSNGFGHDLHFDMKALDSSSVRMNLTGSIMYLLDSTGKTRTIPENGFKRLFLKNGLQDSVSPVSMPKIPADNLGDNCCEEMFNGCYKLLVYETTASGRIPWSVNASGTVADNWNTNMLSATGGTFKDDPVNGTTYYIGN